MGVRLLEILVEKGKLHAQKAEEIRLAVSKTGKSEEQLLLDSGLLSDLDVSQAKSEEFNIPFVNLAEVKIPNDLLSRIDSALMRTYRAVPFEETPDVLKVAMRDPFDIPAIQALQHAIANGKKMEVYIAAESQIGVIIEKRLQEGISTEVHAALEDVEQPVTEINDVTEDISKAEGSLINAPVARIVNSLLTYGVRVNASDIHVEPQEKEVRVRYRVHGVMLEKLRLPKSVHQSVIARVKILASLKIDEKRIPQDGRFQIQVQERRIDLRVSTLPTVHGEKVVMRLLERTGGVPALETTGLRGSAYKSYLEATKSTSGIVLISGPTGSGKTRTLAGTMAKLNTMEVNIISLEDPVEIRIPGVNQVQINPDAGLTFAFGLRSILRQDPNIIMVGEIRDAETAGLAVQAALTGHLVLSTIHTNSASAALPRLIDMNIEPYLLASVLQLVVAQRLPRRICPHCKQVYVAPKEVLEVIAEVMSTVEKFDVVQYLLAKCKSQDAPGVETTNVQCPVDRGDGTHDVYLYKGAGCDECGQTGYLGRIGIFEVLKVSEKIGKMILENRSSMDIQKEALASGMISMQQDGYLKALEGITTIEEVLRVCRD
ncbi:MAG: GspE/PulE family protein [Candidatus Dojkabacteria bacterium]|nr:GspE/PulE family protein [Candidatus Dojkabacteria bacterium]